MLTKNERLEQYGITSNEQALFMIERACDIFGNKNNNYDKVFIEKLSRHESHLGNITDHSSEYGEHVVQFDLKTFLWVIERLQEKKYLKYRELFKKFYGYPIAMIQYDELRHNPEIGFALCRLRFKFIPDLFPDDDDGQWKLYKKHWNGIDTKNEKGGAATREKWDRDTKDCYFKAGE